MQGVGRSGGKVGFRPKKKCIHLLLVLMLYIPSSSGSLVLTQPKQVLDR